MCFALFLCVVWLSEKDLREVMFQLDQQSHFPNDSQYGQFIYII